VAQLYAPWLQVRVRAWVVALTLTRTLTPTYAPCVQAELLLAADDAAAAVATLEAAARREERLPRG